MSSARYALYLIGFQCNHETKDDALQSDGKRDEVYFTHQVNRYNGVTGASIPSSSRQITGRTMGDTYQQSPFRIRVGSGDGPNGAGGIKNGDIYPNPIPYDFGPNSPKNDLWPPYKLWEGDLTQGTGDTYVVTVMLWEWDNGTSMLADIVRWFGVIDKTYGQRAKDIFTKVYPPNELIFSAVSLAIETLNTIADLLGNSESRPIGLSPPVNGKATWNGDAPIIIALNYETAESLLQADSGLGSGVISKNLKDDPKLEGDYDVYLKFCKITQYEDEEGDLATNSKTFTIDASNPKFQSDGGATISGFIETGSTSEDILATVTGWKPGGGQHPTSIMVKRANQGGKDGIWFRLNFVGDVANGITSISFYQGGRPIWNTAPDRATTTFDAPPWH